MTNPRYGAIKTNVAPKKNTGLYFGFIVRQYKTFRQVTGHDWRKIAITLSEGFRVLTPDSVNGWANRRYNPYFLQENVV
jgi:hypothetical protein